MTLLHLLAIPAAYTVYWLLVPFFKPLKPRPNSKMLRSRLRSRLNRGLGTPTLCDAHARATVASGEMAVIDNRNCELCRHAKKAA